MNKTKIDWVDMTWNPVTGCLHGCEYCYAEKIANRFGQNLYSTEKLHVIDEWKFNSERSCGMSNPFPWNFEPTLHKNRLGEPTKVKNPQKIFVCSMADLFGEWVPDEWIQDVFKACEAAPQHKYLFLTKNPKRYGELNNGKGVPDKSNFWYGSTVTKKGDLFACIKTPRLHRSNYFVSIEPLLGVPEDLSTLAYVDWVIVGEQTGPGAKPPKDVWVQSIIDQCRAANVPVFVKSPLYEKFPIQEWPDGLRKEREIDELQRSME